MENQGRSKLLGEMPMKQLVPKISVPIMISMLVQALYNVVDSIFVAKYNADALTAVSLAFPVQTLMIALSVGLGVGINSLISRRLGEHNHEAAINGAWAGLLMEFIGFVLFALFGAIFVLVCDMIGRVVIAPYELPIELIVGILGSILFIGLLLYRLKHGRKAVRFDFTKKTGKGAAQNGTGGNA